MAFKGFSAGSNTYSRLPDVFFGELLPQIDHLGELKVTLYTLWKIEHAQGDFPYLREADFFADERFTSGLAVTPEEIKSTLSESLSRAVDRGTLLGVNSPEGEQLIFINTPKGRAAVAAIRRGDWHPQKSYRAEPVLTAERPNIYQLFEKNIGVLTPMLAESLKDAEDEYPQEWVEEAIRIAVEKNVRNWRYIEAILRRWQERGYDVRNDRRDIEESRQEYSNWEND